MSENYHSEAVDQAREEFLTEGLLCIHKINNKVVRCIQDVLKMDKVKVKNDDAVKQFKQSMIEMWQMEAANFWSDKNLKCHLRKLEELKSKSNSTDSTTWRSSKHSVEEQTQINRINATQHAIDVTKELIERQSTDLQKLIEQVMEERTFFKELSKRRQCILDQVEVEMFDIDNKLLE